MRKKRKFKFKPRFFALLALLICIVGFIGFGLVIKSGIGLDLNGRSTETEYMKEYKQGYMLMLAAKKYINNDKLVYDTSYFSGGYPPDDKGVCTDVIWTGFNGINVDLKQLVDSDIANDFNAYSGVITTVDTNIDFRYVPVLDVFFHRKAEVLSTDLTNPLLWMPGDIVTFENGEHVAVVSCLRNLFGEPYIIQHGKDPAGDEDRINAIDGLDLTYHYRWPLISK